MYVPSASYAPWQKGKVERKIRTFKESLQKAVLHVGVKGEKEAKTAGIEVVSAINQRPGQHGVSAAMMLFGQKLKLYGEIYADGEPYHHIDSAPGSELARRFLIRSAATQSVEHHHSKEAVRLAAAARTRVIKKVDTGEYVFFYRNYPSKAAIRLQSQRGYWLGPAIVIGEQGHNYWLSFAGRCYIVAPEHIRGLAPDEQACNVRPLLRRGLEEMRQAAKSKDFVDVSDQIATEQDLAAALLQPVPESDPALYEEPATKKQAVKPETVSGPTVSPAASSSAVLPVPHAIEVPPEETQMIQEEVDAHLDSGTTEAEATRKRSATEATAETSAASAAEQQPAVTWQPQGNTSNLKWRKHDKGEGSKDAFAAYKPQLSAKLEKKQLDKEVPYSQIDPRHRSLYHEAERKEWSSWTKNGSVRIVKGGEAKGIRSRIHKSKIIRLRFVYRDKNASIRTPQVPLPVKAKARLCAQASREPLAMMGLLKLDSPTVQRVGIGIFVQVTVNLKWQSHWRKGDITSAFLQGKGRDSEVKGELYLEPPTRPLEGVDEGDLLQAIKSVYGLPDAPRAWWQEVTGFLRSLGFQHSRMDPAYMVHYKPDGSFDCHLILHVDDLMVSGDGSPLTEKIIQQIHSKYPFGEWLEVQKEKDGVTYTGRTIRCVGTEVSDPMMRLVSRSKKLSLDPL